MTHEDYAPNCGLNTRFKDLGGGGVEREKEEGRKVREESLTDFKKEKG